MSSSMEGQLMETRSKTILLEGPHLVGKSSLCDSLCKQTDYVHTLIDRGFASNWAFSQLYSRRLRPRLDLSIHDYFGNPAAVVVHFVLGSIDYDLDLASSAPRREQWVGLSVTYKNRQLDELIACALARAEQLGYGDRILHLTARADDLETQTKQVLEFISS